MAKQKQTLMTAAMALPESSELRFEARLKATGRKDEVDELIDAWKAGKFASKIPSRAKLADFLTESLGIRIHKATLGDYLSKRYGKKAH